LAHPLLDLGLELLGLDRGSSYVC